MRICEGQTYRQKETQSTAVKTSRSAAHRLCIGLPFHRLSRLVQGHESDREVLKIHALLTACPLLLRPPYITHRSSMSSRMEATVGPDPR